MAHNHKAQRRYNPASGHPEGQYFRRGGGPGRYAKGENATDRNKRLREACAEAVADMVSHIKDTHRGQAVPAILG